MCARRVRMPVCVSLLIWARNIRLTSGKAAHSLPYLIPKIAFSERIFSFIIFIRSLCLFISIFFRIIFASLLSSSPSVLSARLLPRVQICVCTSAPKKYATNQFRYLFNSFVLLIFFLFWIVRCRRNQRHPLVVSIGSFVREWHRFVQSQIKNERGKSGTFFRLYVFFSFFFSSRP